MNGVIYAKPASEIEMMIMQSIWDEFPHMPKVCPNCLASRHGSVIDTPHADWCAIKRRVKQEEQKASEYLVCI